MLPRIYNLEKLLVPGKALILFGPRRVGKTTLLQTLLDTTLLRYRFETGDNLRVRQILSSQDFDHILPFAEGVDLIALDEAQQIPNIGMGLKILVDHTPGLRIIATGSSSFDLSQQVGEPLTGRKRTIVLYPFSQQELLVSHNRQQLTDRLPEFLVFGTYPEVALARGRKGKIRRLDEIVQSYLLKDIFSIDRLRAPDQLVELLKLLAFQVGNEVSLNELAMQVRLDIKTVARYLDLLEKTFVIKRIGAFSRNLRNTIASKAKYYFYDNGIRNGVISQYNMPEDRNDIGPLFENFVMMERIKYRSYNEMYGTMYFWRSYRGKEIDLIEEYDGRQYAYEIKWSPEKPAAKPQEWKDSYPDASFKVINRENYLDFIMPKRKTGANNN